MLRCKGRYLCATLSSLCRLVDSQLCFAAPCCLGPCPRTCLWCGRMGCAEVCVFVPCSLSVAHGGLRTVRRFGCSPTLLPIFCLGVCLCVLMCASRNGFLGCSPYCRFLSVQTSGCQVAWLHAALHIRLQTTVSTALSSPLWHMRCRCALFGGGGAV